MIRRCFSGFTRKKVLMLYTSLIRPILEYVAPVWSPWQVRDKELLEKTQKRCLRLCPEEIELESLQEQRERTDLIETFKFKKGVYRTNPSRMFTPSHIGQLRGHSEKNLQTSSQIGHQEIFLHPKSDRPVEPTAGRHSLTRKNPRLQENSEGHDESLR